jgi:hypothetical protein
VRHADDLRPTGRPGREHEDGVRVRIDRIAIRPVGASARAEGFIGDHREASTQACRNPAEEPPIREDGRTPDDVRIAADVVRSELVGERHGDMTELHDGQVCGHPEERVGAEYADPRTRREIQSRQLGGQPPRGRTQVIEGVACTTLHHGDAVPLSLRQEVVTGVQEWTRRHPESTGRQRAKRTFAGGWHTRKSPGT